MAPAHTPAFLAFRTRVLAELDDAGRARLARFLGCMTEPLPDLPSELAAVVRAFAALDASDRGRVVRWFGAYVSRWGQVPVAASRSVAATTGGFSAVVPSRAAPAASDVACDASKERGASGPRP